MGRILDKALYPLDQVVSKDDYLLGTDIDQNLKTVNFSVGSILRLVNSELNFVSTEFRFSDMTDPELTEAVQGIFTSIGETNPEAVQKLLFNKKNIGGQDLTDLFTLMNNNVYTFSLKLVNASDPADVFYFKVLSVVTSAEYYELNVQVIGQGYTRTLTDLTTYNLFMEVVGSQNNKNVVKSVSVAGVITEAKTAAAINALPLYTITDEQNVFYHVTSDDGSEVTYIAVDKGKDSYGAGGTQFVAEDLQYISSSTAGSVLSVVKQEVTYSGTHSIEKVVAGVNALPTFSLGNSSLLYVFAKSDSYQETYVFVARGLTAGDYGTGSTQITADKIDLISVMGGGNSNIVKDVIITGEPTGTNVAAAINALALFTVGPSQNVYYRVTLSGTSTVYTFITQGKSSGDYGAGGIQLVAADLSLLSVNSGGTAWNLKVGGVQKKAVKEGETVDFKGSKYAVVTYNADGGIVEISTSQALDELLAKFKPTYMVTKAQYEQMKTAGTLDPNGVYLKSC